MKKAVATIQDKILCIALIKHLGSKYSLLRRELANAYALVDNKYPTNLTNALRVLNVYIGPVIPKDKDNQNPCSLNKLMVEIEPQWLEALERYRMESYVMGVIP